MNSKPIIIVCGEPNSIFSELLAKSFKKYQSKNPIILIGSYKLICLQLKKLRYRIKLNQIELKNESLKNIKLDRINIININYNFVKFFEPISSRSNEYINECFNKAFNIIRKNKVSGFINGPISKKFFLKKKYPGITEYLAHRTKTNNCAMLIYNKDLSVCPLTTHLPLKNVSKKINGDLIKRKIKLIDNFFQKHLKLKPKMALTGLNPHCESIESFNEDEKIIRPAIKSLAYLNNRISGPYAADTIFLKKNREKYNVIIGMYHDQVLTPIKTLFEYDAINITLGLPFIRISPDHGPNEKMLGKNKSNPLSLIKAFTFLDFK